MVKIALDAMGGDEAPRIPVMGALSALEKDSNLTVLLVGLPETLEPFLKDAPPEVLRRLVVVPATDVVEMHEHPVEALRRKRGASILVATELVRRGDAQAVISAGNTGACFAAAHKLLGRIPGIWRPAIPISMPARQGWVVLIDGGANVDCRPRHLCHFALMGEVYARVQLGISNPRIGLLSNGEEPGKGNELGQRTFELMSRYPIQFVGNVEGCDIAGDKADVIVTDGFVGNVALKEAEGYIRLFADMMARHAVSDQAREVIGRMQEEMKAMDKNERGGEPLLGINGVSIICHGSSTERGIESAFRQAINYVKKDIVAQIATKLGHMPADLHGESDDE